MKTAAELKLQLERYAAKRLVALVERLGGGTDGEVWSTSVSTVLKAFERTEVYENEIACYHRLSSSGISSIKGFTIPELERCDGELLVIELSTVKAPYLLDFGKAYLDRPHDFSAEVMEDWEARNLETWGPYLPIIRSIIGKLRSVGIIYLDTKVGNIKPDQSWNLPD
jgi:hypothetical protein